MNSVSPSVARSLRQFVMKMWEESAPGAQESVERCVRPLGVGVCEVMPAECDDFSIAFDSGQVVLMTVVAQETLHEPSFSMVGVHVENSIEKDLGNVPTLFGNCAGDVTPVDADHRVIARGLVVRVRLEKTD